MAGEIIKWVKIITVIWPIIWFVAVLAFLAVYSRPLGRILERFNCEDLERIRIGPFEAVKRCRPNKTRRRKSKQ